MADRDRRRVKQALACGGLQPAPFLLCVLLAGCGQVGPPVPPSLKIPITIGDLGLFERGENLVIDFTATGASTDGVLLNHLDSIDLQINSRAIPVARHEPGPVHVAVPAREWLGQEVVARVRTQGPSGRWSAWSNQVRMKVVTPLPTVQIQAASAPTGAKLTWPAAPGASYRVFRRGPTDLKPALAATVAVPEYTDRQARFGSTYEYAVQSFVTSGDSEAQSEPSEPVSITPVDTFPPAVPSGVSAVPGPATIDLSWTPASEPDLRGYYVYRSEDSQPFARLGDVLERPAYSDRAVASGHRYRYEISTVDQRGNESAHSAAVEAALP
jgi:hypothetical protein